MLCTLLANARNLVKMELRKEHYFSKKMVNFVFKLRFDQLPDILQKCMTYQQKANFIVFLMVCVSFLQLFQFLRYLSFFEQCQKISSFFVGFLMISCNKKAEIPLYFKILLLINLLRYLYKSFTVRKSKDQSFSENIENSLSFGAKWPKKALKTSKFQYFSALFCDRLSWSSCPLGKFKRQPFH